MNYITRVDYFPKCITAHYVSTLRFAPASQANTFSILTMKNYCGAHQWYNVCTKFREIQLTGSKLETGEHRTYKQTSWWSHKRTSPFYEGKHANKKGIVNCDATPVLPAASFKWDRWDALTWCGCCGMNPGEDRLIFLQLYSSLETWSRESLSIYLTEQDFIFHWPYFLQRCT